MSYFDDISEFLQKGRAPKVKETVLNALNDGINPQDILEKGLLVGMDIIGGKFKNNEVFVPEVLLAARAMNSGMEVLKPYLVAAGVCSKGVAVIGTVKGDLHDIGKNLVKMMMEGKGITTIDLGVDVPAERFVEEAKNNNADVICCSALLTTTMSVMKDITDLAKKTDVRAKIIIGGAPVTKEFCDSIGADGYSTDAASAAELALLFCNS